MPSRQRGGTPNDCTRLSSDGSSHINAPHGCAGHSCTSQGCTSHDCTPTTALSTPGVHTAATATDAHRTSGTYRGCILSICTYRRQTPKAELPTVGPSDSISLDCTSHGCAPIVRLSHSCMFVATIHCCTTHDCTSQRGNCQRQLSSCLPPHGRASFFIMVAMLASLQIRVARALRDVVSVVEVVGRQS